MSTQDAERLRQLVSDHYHGLLTLESYRKERAELLDNIRSEAAGAADTRPRPRATLERPTAPARGSPDVSLEAPPAPRRSRTPIIGAVAVAGVMVAVSVVVFTGDDPSDTSPTASPDPVPSAALGRGERLLASFLDRNDWSNDSLSNLATAWNALAESDREAATADRRYRRLVGAVHQRIREEVALGDDSLPRLQVLASAAEALGSPNKEAALALETSAPQPMQEASPGDVPAAPRADQPDVPTDAPRDEARATLAGEAAVPAILSPKKPEDPSVADSPREPSDEVPVAEASPELAGDDTALRADLEEPAAAGSTQEELDVAAVSDVAVPPADAGSAEDSVDTSGPRESAVSPADGVAGTSDMSQPSTDASAAADQASDVAGPDDDTGETPGPVQSAAALADAATGTSDVSRPPSSASVAAGQPSDAKAASGTAAALQGDPCPPSLASTRRPYCVDQLGDTGKGPPMVVLRAGTFRMGSDSAAEEGPAHDVTIPVPFAISRYEVSAGEFMRFCQARPAQCGDWSGPGDDHPAILVTWDQATGYADWLSEMTGARYRLPSEAEWEYAARGGTTTPYPFGDEITPTAAHSSVNGPVDRPAPRSSRSVNRNGFKLMHMSGNVREWVQDDWYADYKNAPADGSARTGSGSPMRVVRGGSFADPAPKLRSAAREPLQASGRDRYTGFRVVRDLDTGDRGN